MKVNLHPIIVNMLEEAKWIRRLGYEVPPELHRISLANVKANYDQLKVVVGVWCSMARWVLNCLCRWYLKSGRGCAVRSLRYS